MSNISNVFTTVSNGATHVAIGKSYLGKVDSYNNCFTQFFAWLFGRSIQVNFEGKVRSVNKESYVNLLQELGVTAAKVDQVQKFTLFKQVAKGVDLTKRTLTMREAVGDTTRQALYKKLVEALCEGNTVRAKLMIGKGAALEFEAYDRGNQHSPAFSRDIDGLYSGTKYSFTVFKGTPLLIAARRANKVAVEMLKEFGADTNAVGKQYSFKREIEGVSRSYEWRMRPRVSFEEKENEVKYDMALEERVDVHTVDKRSEKIKFQLDASLALVQV